MESQAPKPGSPRQVGLKRLKSLQGLAVAELVLALVIIPSLIALIMLSVFAPLFSASGFIFGLLSIISGGLGIGAFRKRGQSHKCLFISHFVLCIISAVIGSLTVFLGFFNLAMMHDRGPRVLYRGSVFGGALAAVWIISLASLALLICHIISASFTCKTWCGGPVDNTSVVFVPNFGNATVALVSEPVAMTVDKLGNAQNA